MTALCLEQSVQEAGPGASCALWGHTQLFASNSTNSPRTSEIRTSEMIDTGYQLLVHELNALHKAIPARVFYISIAAVIPWITGEHQVLSTLLAIAALLLQRDFTYWRCGLICTGSVTWEHADVPGELFFLLSFPLFFLLTKQICLSDSTFSTRFLYWNLSTWGQGPEFKSCYPLSKTSLRLLALSNYFFAFVYCGDFMGRDSINYIS